MNVLIACEESQTVCKAFLAKGHNAFSCDLQECSGGLPDRPIKGDCLQAIKAGNIQTQLGKSFFIDHWDLMIAHQFLIERSFYVYYYFNPGIDRHFLHLEEILPH